MGPIMPRRADLLPAEERAAVGLVLIAGTPLAASAIAGPYRRKG